MAWGGVAAWRGVAESGAGQKRPLMHQMGSLGHSSCLSLARSHSAPWVTELQASQFLKAENGESTTDAQSKGHLHNSNIYLYSHVLICQDLSSNVTFYSLTYFSTLIHIVNVCEQVLILVKAEDVNTSAVFEIIHAAYNLY